MKIPRILGIILVAGAFGLPTAARAAVIASDNFSYTAGDNLSGLNGGTGWANAWTASSSSAASATIQNHGGSTVAQFTGTLPNSDNFAVRTLSSAYTGDTVFASFTLELNFVPDSDFFALWLDTTTSNNHGGGRLNMGLGLSNYLFARADSATSPSYTVNSTTTAASSTVYQLVAQYSKSTPGAANAFNTVTFWVNPANGGFATPIGSKTYSGAASFTYVGFRGAANEGGETFWVDDLTLATTWDDVVPVPEPGSISLVAAGVVFLAWAFRRRFNQSSHACPLAS